MAYREPAPQTPPDIRAAPEPDPEQARRKRNRNIALTGAVIIAVILLIVLLRHHAASQAQKGAADAAATRNRAVPVAVAAVQIRDVPVFLDGLGNVNALKTTVAALFGGLPLALGSGVGAARKLQRSAETEPVSA